MDFVIMRRTPVAQSEIGHDHLSGCSLHPNHMDIIRNAAASHLGVFGRCRGRLGVCLSIYGQCSFVRVVGGTDIYHRFRCYSLCMAKRSRDGRGVAMDCLTPSLCHVECVCMALYFLPERN